MGKPRKNWPGLHKYLDEQMQPQEETERVSTSYQAKVHKERYSRTLNKAVKDPLIKQFIHLHDAYEKNGSYKESIVGKIVCLFHGVVPGE